MNKVKLLYVAFGMCVLVAITILAVRPKPLVFDSESWRYNPKVRPQMLHDLLASQRLNGSSRRDVASLLGDPIGQDSKANDRYVYWVGYSGIDDQWMEIRFQQDSVVDVSIYPD